MNILILAQFTALAHGVGHPCGIHSMCYDRPAVAAPGCSIERGAVKYLKDPASAKINWIPKRTTIGALQKIPAMQLTYALRTPAELQVYVVRALLTKVKVESDGDYHLILNDKGKTMIAEIPSPSCVTNKHLPTLAQDRAAALSLVGKTIDITGVLFLDFAHGQTGHAPNYVELHPVTAIKKLP